MRGRTSTKGFSYGPPIRTPRKRIPRANDIDGFTINIFRLFFSSVCFLYSILTIILYSTSYIHLILGQTYRSDLRTLLMLWNSFKPLAILVVAYCCSQKSMVLWKCFVFGSFVGCVFIGSFLYLIVMVYDYAYHCNDVYADFDSACNHPLYCCVHFNKVAACHNKGPCTQEDPLNSDTTTPTYKFVTQNDLSPNSNFVLAFWLFLLSFVLESILLYMFYLILNSINSGQGLFMDTSATYAFPTVREPQPRPTFLPGTKPTSYTDELIGARQGGDQKDEEYYDDDDEKGNTDRINNNKKRIFDNILLKKIYHSAIFNKMRRLVERITDKVRYIILWTKSRWVFCKFKVSKVYAYIKFNIREIFVLPSQNTPPTFDNRNHHEANGDMNEHNHDVDARKSLRKKKNGVSGDYDKRYTPNNFFDISPNAMLDSSTGTSGTDDETEDTDNCDYMDIVGYSGKLEKSSGNRMTQDAPIATTISTFSPTFTNIIPSNRPIGTMSTTNTTPFPSLSKRNFNDSFNKSYI